MSKLILIYLTNPSKQHAINIAKHLLDKKLIACGNIFPCDSIYVWKNKLEEEGEHILIAKTLEEQFDKVKKEIKQLHPYEIPCIVKIDAEANKSYVDWVSKAVKK